MPVEALAWLGRQGTRAIAVLVFIGIAVPSIGDALKPFISEAIFLLVCVSFMRVDMSSLRDHLRRPGIIFLTTAWTSLAVPLIFGLGCLATGLNKYSPDLFLGLMLQAVASPTMAAPALTVMMGLESTLVLITLVTSTALVPLVAPLFVYAFFGDKVTLVPLTLGLKLFTILAGALFIAVVIRSIVGVRTIKRYQESIDGLNILFLLVFVIAIMGTVASNFLADPLKTIGLGLFSFVVFFALLGLTMLIFGRFGSGQALALGFVVAQRNLGLMLAATEGVLPGLTWLYFALCQFPIFLSPQMLRPFARKYKPK